MGRLNGKVAIVTGSAHGIGRASAMIMAREGATICVAGEIGVPDDIDYVAAFLASDEARYLTGQHIPVDGGQLMHTPIFADVNRLAGGNIEVRDRS